MKNSSEKIETIKKSIIKAAEAEFAEKGFFGARVDAIAERSKVNKRIIYSYFGNKEELYKVVLHDAYQGMAIAESSVFADCTSCEDAIRRVIKMYFVYMEQNPTYVSLILWENLNKGEYVKTLDFSDIKNKVYKYLYRIIEAGKKNGEFKEEISEEQTILSIMSFPFSYFSNKYTLPKLLNDKLDFDKEITKRIEYVTNMLLSYIKK